jgi:hypothetical protein
MDLHRQILVTIYCALALQQKWRVLLIIRITNDETKPVLQFELSALMIM